MQYWDAGRSRFCLTAPVMTGALTITASDAIDGIDPIWEPSSSATRRPGPEVADEPALSIAPRCGSEAPSDLPPRSGWFVVARRWIGADAWADRRSARMMAWAAVSMQQQRAIVQRNLGRCLGAACTVFTRDAQRRIGSGST